MNKFTKFVSFIFFISFSLVAARYEEEVPIYTDKDIDLHVLDPQTL